MAVGGGVGIALIWPIAGELARLCEQVCGIISARREDLLILQEEMRAVCDELQVATDDGSAGYHGFPTDLLEQMLASGQQVDAVYAVGPVPMMAAVSEVTRPYGVRTVVSLNPIMVDGERACAAGAA